MANIAHNIAFFTSFEEAKAKEIVEFFNQNFDVVDEPDDEDIEEGYFEIHFDSRWVTPKEKLVELTQNFVVEVTGVSYERGNLYVSCWVFSGMRNNNGSIVTDFKIHEL